MYKQEIRIITYMCPSHPVELYELIMELLETSLNCNTSLLYESRSPAPLQDRPNPFIEDKVDLGFLSAASYMGLRTEVNAGVQLLPVTPVFSHHLDLENKPGYCSDVIVHRDKKAHNVNTLLDLRGCTFAYSDKESLSGNKIVLKTLKERGENASFFGSLLRSGSHLESIQMVLSKQADWAAIDSSTLLNLNRLYDGAKDLVILETLGRLPPYPIVVNNRLPDDIKVAITNAFLSLPKTVEWKKKFSKFGVVNFETNCDDAYRGTAQKVWTLPSEMLNVRYY